MKWVHKIKTSHHRFRQYRYSPNSTTTQEERISSWTQIPHFLILITHLTFEKIWVVILMKCLSHNLFMTENPQTQYLKLSREAFIIFYQSAIKLLTTLLLPKLSLEVLFVWNFLNPLRSSLLHDLYYGFIYFQEFYHIEQYWSTFWKNEEIYYI